MIQINIRFKFCPSTHHRSGLDLAYLGLYLNSSKPDLDSRSTFLLVDTKSCSCGILQFVLRLHFGPITELEIFAVLGLEFSQNIKQKMFLFPSDLQIF